MNTRPDSNSADPQQIIAELRRQLAERTAERDEGLAREAANAEVLGVINSSPGDLAPVFDAILEKAMRLCDGAQGALWIFDGEHVRAAAALGNSPEFDEVLKGLRGLDPGEHDPTRRIMRGERLIQILDLAEDRSGDPFVTAAVTAGGVRTVTFVALIKDGVPLGAFAVARREVRPFTDKQVALLENFAAQAVIAMENARLIAETREALEQQTATAEVLGVINSSPGNLAPVFDAMLDKATRLCDAPTGIFWTDDGEFSRAVALHGVPTAYAEYVREPLRMDAATGLYRVQHGQAFVATVDMADEEPYRAGHPHRRAIVDLGRARSAVRVPLIKDGRALGVFVLYRQEVRPFTDKQIALLQNFAAQAVIAMENARLITETREALEQQTATAEVLGVINSSPGDLTPVFDAMLERAARLCEADFGTLWTFDGDRFHPVVARGHVAAAAGPGAAPDGVKPSPSVPLGRIVAGESIVHVLDAASDVGFQSDGFGRARAAALGLRSSLAVALRKDGILRGAITVSRRQVRAFSDKQIALLQNFAAQAVIAMENARLLTETREALEQQTATAEVLGVINSSPGDLAPVFDAMLEKAMRLCEASFGLLSRIDGGHSSAVAVHGVPPVLAEQMRQPRPVAPGNAHYRLMQGEDVVQVADITDDDAYRSGEPGRIALADVGGARTALWVALRKDKAALGAFVAYRQEVRPFTDKQIALLQNFAAQAVIAMENARLITETREALEQQTATAEVLGVINSSPGDLAPVFDAMLERAVKLCEFDFATLWTYDGSAFQPVARHRVPDRFWQYLREHTPPGFAPLESGEPLVHIPDMAQTGLYDTDFGRGLRALGGDPVRSVLIVPLRKDAALLGVINAYRYEARQFSEKQIALLQNFAAQAVIAIENARLITETREALEQQTATAEVLGVINSSPGDLAPVFDAMLEKAMRLCGANYGNLLRYDGEQFHVVAATDGQGQRVGHSFRPSPGTGICTIVDGENVLSIEDLPNTESYRVGSPFFRELVERGGYRSLLNVALRKDGALLGAFTIFRQEVRPFTDREIALVENFAAQAVIAMENARLITETREALEQQTATAEVLGVINASPGDLVPVFDAMLDKALRLCGAAFGHLLIFDGESFHRKAVRGEPRLVDHLREDDPIQPIRPAGALLPILGGENIIEIADLLESDAYRHVPRFRAVVDLGGYRSLLNVALRREGAVLGVLAIFRKEPGTFSDKQIALLQNFAAQAVIAMENARLLGELRQRNDEIAGWNRELEDRVAAQLSELERVGKLKRFLAPQLAELIVARGDEAVLETHRRDIVVVFCDLRDFTAFAETAEPEEVLDLLREYHGALGPVVSASEGTLDHFSGDGIMVFFNDPVPVADASERAVHMAIAMRAAMARLQEQWRRQGRRIGFGAGIARGYATLGQIGFADRIDYTAIGTVCNLAARLCAEAKDGQILVSQRVAAAVEGAMPLEEIGEVALKGLTQPVAVYNVPFAGGQAALRVIEGGAPSA